MANLKEEAKAYKSQSIGNIADLPKVSTLLQVEDREAVDDDDKPYSFKAIVIDEAIYRVPKSVLKSLKAILEDNPNLQFFKVKKTGTGMNTEYTVIPLL